MILDCLNFALAIDNFIADEYRHLKPHKSVHDLSEPYKVSGIVAIPKPVIATMAEFLCGNDSETIHPQQQSNFNELLKVAGV